jgi:phage gpG-like protein
MSSVTLDGNWGPITVEVESILSKATDEVGNEIVARFHKHFASQDLGWAPLAESTQRKKVKGIKRSLRSVSTNELRYRAEKVGVAGHTTMSRGGLVSGLSSKSAILIDSGLLSRSFTYKRLSSISGQVGVMRTGPNGANLAAIHEYGSPSKNIPARPFVKPVANEMQGEIEKIYNKYIQSVTIK